MSFWKTIACKEDPCVYDNKDDYLVRSLKVRDFLVLGVGTIVSASIFTLPGEAAAMHTGLPVVTSFLVTVIMAELVTFAYAEMVATVSFVGSAYSWINVVFGEPFGWVAGQALLIEYLIALAFVGSSLSADFRALLVPLGWKLPASSSNTFGTEGGVADIVSVAVIILAAPLISHGMSQVARVENLFVILKVFAISLFIVVNLTAIKASNFMPFIPQYHETVNDALDGWRGIYAGVSMIFLSYIEFGSIAANSVEAINPQKTMPRGILGSLVITVVPLMVANLVLIGVLSYQQYANSAEPVGLALCIAHHSGVATAVQTIAALGTFTALIGMNMAGSRLIHSSGHDGMLPKWLGRPDKHNRPSRIPWTLTIGAVLVGTLLPFAFLSQLTSASTLITFTFVSLGTYALRCREGKDTPNPSFKTPLYPVLPALDFLASLLVFMRSDYRAELYASIWFVFGLTIYFAYGMRHPSIAKKEDGQNAKSEAEARENEWRCFIRGRKRICSCCPD